jgi:hypothetical protein
MCAERIGANVVLVRLSHEELERAACVGAQRVAFNIAEGRQNRYGHDGLGWDVHCDGACAEYAAAKYFHNGLWTPSTTELDTAGDLGDGLQVRSTKWSSGRLIVHDADAGDHRFVLAIVDLPRVRLVGWISGADAKRPEYMDDPTHSGRDAYFVPQRKLHPLPQKVLLPT